jgi:hypothetical protein
MLARLGCGDCKYLGVEGLEANVSKGSLDA